MTMPKRVEGVVAMKQHFVLVHGIGGGSWCWYKIRCLMENSGCKVSCIDLKSAGIDQSDADSVLSFDDYNKPLMDFMSDLPENEQVLIYMVLYMLILSLSGPYVLCKILNISRDSIAISSCLLIWQQIANKCGVNCSEKQLKNLDVVVLITISDLF